MRLRPLALLAAVTLAAGLTVAPAAAAGPEFAADPTTLVDTSIGNNGDGTTFPGAAVPYGMVQLSPDTQLKKYASYDYANGSILGFSNTHLSGIGCQTMGNFRFMPTTGPVTTSDPNVYGSTFSHANEKASPGYHSVGLDNGVGAELTATERTGGHRYSYPSDAGQNVLIEVGESNGYTFGGEVRVVGDDTVEGWLEGGNFCWETQKERYRVHFSAKFDRPFASFGTWTDDALTPGARNASLGKQRNGAWLTFDPAAGDQVGASVGLSYTSVEGAQLNRNAEARGFDQAADSAHRTWQRELERMRVAGGTVGDQRTYYSALYRSLLHPSIGSDVDGRYRGLDDEVHHADHPYYQMFSLWDTYRSQNQLVALLHPRRAADMARSVLRISEDAGWVPRWALAGGETNVMSGDPVTPWVVTLYRRGLLDDHTARGLFDALWRNANEVPADQSAFRGRDGNPSYTANGWIGYQDVPGYTFGDTRQAGSATLEYAFADCALSTMAAGLGEQDKADALAARCGNPAKQWDATQESLGYKGFPRARTTDGAWVGSADPTEATGFHEGTAWQYQWLAQQDVPALFDRMGGRDQAEKRLDTFFDMPLLLVDPVKASHESWVIGAYDYDNNFAFNPNNEPDLHAPWMYTWTGAPWKTSAVLRAARTLFTDTPYGMPGNDDLGTISSWLVFGMAGVFEAAPGSGDYLLSAPMFEKVEIHPEGGKKIRIDAPGADANRFQYVDRVQTGRGQELDRTWLSHEELLSAKEVRFTLADQPTDWGTGPGTAPLPLTGR